MKFDLEQTKIEADIEALLQKNSFNILDVFKDTWLTGEKKANAEEANTFGEKNQSDSKIISIHTKKPFYILHFYSKRNISFSRYL